MGRLLFIITVCISLLSTTTWAANDSNSSKQPSSTSTSSTEQTSSASQDNANDSTDAQDEAIFDTLQQSQPKQQKVEDPLEPYNRWMFNVNEHLDKWVAKPIAQFYVDIVPPPIQTMVNNGYSNLGYIPTIANDVFQANLYQATSDSWRFVINSTLGIGGLFDVASHFGLPENHQSFGLTLAKWGWEESSYFVLPVLGPSTIRDALGKPVTLATSIYPFMNSTTAEWGLYAGSLLNRRVQMLKYEGVMQQASFNKYTFLRNAYKQRQDYLIQQNEEHDIPYSAKQTRYFAQPNYLYR